MIGEKLILNFATEFTTCNSCGTVLKVEKVKSRNVISVTLGSYTARETIMVCDKCHDKYRSSKLPQLIKPGSRFSYDCITKVGMLRYMQKRQITEIKEILEEKHHIKASDTQIRRMAYRFLDYTGRLHYSKSKQINSVVQNQGGYILYVDSTCEGRSAHLLTCIDGISGIVLFSQKIASENKTSLIESFNKVKSIYGRPLCTVHDMGPGIINALNMVFPNIRHIICHFHFLRDLGKDLLQEPARRIQKILSNEEIYAKIRYQTQELEKLIDGRSSAEELFFQVADNNIKQEPDRLLKGILYGLLLNLKSHEKKSDSYGFPFDRPKLTYYHLLIKTYEYLEEIDKHTVFTAEQKKNARLYKIRTILLQIMNNESLNSAVIELEQCIVYFDKLRTIMRIALPGTKSGLNDQGQPLSAEDYKMMKVKLKRFVKQLEKDKKKFKEESTDFKKLTGVIKQLNKHWDSLFADPIKVIAKGMEKEIFPARTNNRSEQFYRKIKQLLRRLHGRPKVTKDMDYLPEEIALIENLKNNDYITSIMNSIEDLPLEFAKLDIENVELPFEKNEDFIVSFKIIHKLAQFDPIKIIKKVA